MARRSRRPVRNRVRRQVRPRAFDDVRRGRHDAYVPDGSPVLQGLARSGWKWSAPRPATAGVLLVLAGVVAMSPAAVTATGSAVLLTKREARRAAVRASADTCREVDWCRGYRVVPPERCQRKSRRTVYCPIAFLTPEGHSCGGGVLVMKSPVDASASRWPSRLTAARAAEPARRLTCYPGRATSRT
jgi:hypothetical protein